MRQRYQKRRLGDLGILDGVLNNSKAYLRGSINCNLQLTFDLAFGQRFPPTDNLFTSATIVLKHEEKARLRGGEMFPSEFHDSVLISQNR